ncbi:hypothetical protein NO2_0939 [Candidatus Termititenax persephonae]|uniref:Uncharacterized protein n=1 Tax=Candidatus Termititenax persephonae TaxID=2218525 RepID=A0A388TGZ1_9BACT|nr:hypothetical protein NO2_0939 [Candidatus Termititenax persephonae]
MEKFMTRNVRKNLKRGAAICLICSAVFAAPGWFVQTDVNQDFRYRLHDYAKEDTLNGASRYRERMRYRLGITSKINDEFSVGVRLLTGDGSNKSTTQTLDSEFTKKAFNLDQAYLSYAPAWVPSVAGKFKATVGKFDVKEGVYTATNGVWDSNISLEGKNLNYTYKDLGVKGLDFFANIGSYVLAGDVNNGVKEQDDGTSVSGGGSPIVLEAKQLGIKWKIADYSVETAYAQYTVPAWNHSYGTEPSIKTPDDKALEHIAVKLGANLTVPYLEKVALLYEDIVNRNEIGIMKSKSNTTSGEPDSVSDKHASAYGIEFGAKIGLPYLKDYSLRYLQRKIENGVGWAYMEDAHKDPNTEGSQIALTLGIVDNVSFTIDQYSLKYLDPLNDSNVPWTDTRFEINVKF